MKSILDPLPLRDSTVWDAYRVARWIPHRYGACGGEPVQYDGSRRLWVWADHASAVIDRVLVDGLPVTAWQWRNAIDSTGHAVTMIEFAEPVDESSSVIARGRGKMHPGNGAVIDNAADVLIDVLVTLGGMAYAPARFDVFRAACADLPVGGSIESDLQAFAVAREVCASIGAVFSTDLADLARLYPSAAGEPTVQVRAGLRLALSAECRRDAIANDLTVRFAHEAGNPRGGVQYDVPASIERVGRVPEVVDAPWVTDSRVAAAVAMRTIAWHARRRWVVTASNVEGDVRIGEFAHLDHPLLPGLVADHMVESVDFDERTDRSTIVFVVPAEPEHELHFVRNTTASSAIEPVTATATLVGNEYGVTIEDADHNPVSGAVCVLDGNITRRSDASGWVSFPAHVMTPGMHTIVASFDGRSVTIVVNIGG